MTEAERIMDEPYEMLRGLFDEDVKKYNLKTADDEIVKYYINHLKSQLKGSIFVPKSDEELLRIAFYLEDMVDDEAKAKGEEVDFAYWLHANYKRNPEFFSKYFDVVKKVPNGETELDSRSDAEEKEFTPFWDNEGNLVEEEIEKESEEEEIEEGESASPLVFDRESQTVVVREKEATLADVLNTAVSAISKAENEQKAKNKQNNTSQIIDDEAVIKAVDELQAARKQELERGLIQVLSKAMRMNFVEKADILAAMTENVVLRQLVTDMFAGLGVKVASTQVDQTTHSVENSKLVFGYGSKYSLEEIKRGFLQAKLKIDELGKEGEDSSTNEIKARESEVAFKATKSELVRTSKQLEQLQEDFKNLLAKPRIEEGKELYHYVCFDVDEESDDLYYLGTTAEEENASGVYPTASIIKTRKRTEAIKFKTKEKALLQIQKIIKNFVRINRKQKISLAHIEKAFPLTILEYEDRREVPKTKKAQM